MVGYQPLANSQFCDITGSEHAKPGKFAHRPVTSRGCSSNIASIATLERDIPVL